MHARTVFISKETSDYRIVTDDPNNWRVVANRRIAPGEIVTLAETGFRMHLRGEEFADVALEPTRECRRVYAASSAVLSDANGDPIAIEVPRCFMNHSCEPNTLDRWDLDSPPTGEFERMAAARDIAEGEELTCDYALEQYHHGPFECLCGAASCRRTIRGFKGLNREQQERLLTRASPYVQEQYRREFIHVSASDGAPLLAGLERGCEWFLEGTVPGRRHGNVNHGFRITEVVHEERTPFQECLIFDNPVYGRVLVLDGIVQLSTSDECIYHEMLVHPPMFAHAKPRRVVIVGGGDGGTLREVLRHDPEQVVMIDIDERFVRIAAEHLPSLSAGAFADRRVTLLFEDASQALLRYEDAFDVAIIDCNDALGPSEALFEESFYGVVARALTGEGVCAVQAGSMLDLEFLQQTRRRMAGRLGRTTGFRLTMPSYHCGEYVFIVASEHCDPSGPDSTALAELQTRRRVVTNHWSPAIHYASQIFPPSSPLW